MGLAATDGRLIRPKDEPTTAKVAFDWYEVLSEGWRGASNCGSRNGSSSGASWN